jgi:hypothetical protein
MQSLADEQRDQQDVIREERKRRRAIEDAFIMPQDVYPGQPVIIRESGRTEYALGLVETVRDRMIIVIMPGGKRVDDILHVEDPRHQNNNRRGSIKGKWEHAPATLKAQAEAIALDARLTRIEGLLNQVKGPKPQKVKAKDDVDPELETLRKRGIEAGIPYAHVMGIPKLTARLRELDDGR